MKGIKIFTLVAGLIFGMAHGAGAIEFKGSGIFQGYFGWSNFAGTTAFENIRSDSNRFQPSQRMRLKVEAIASENLRAVFQIENNILWGNNATGGELSGDGVNIEVRHVYLDWIIPSTNIKIRMGLQPYALPYMVADSPIFDDDATGLTISKVINENVAVTAFWMRAYNNNSVYPSAVSGAVGEPAGHDAADFFALIVPLTFNGFNITPWGMYGQTGKRMSWNINNTIGADGNNSDMSFFNDATIWYLGISAELIKFEPFRVAIDFNYGNADTAIEAQSAAGYYVGAIAEYTLDMATPGLLVWYASGNDADAATKGSGLMPELSANWTGTSFGFADYFGSGNDSTEVFGDAPQGTAGIALQAVDISFMENLTHTARVAYYVGTNNEAGIDASLYHPVATSNFLSENDTVWEFNLNSNYQIYDNLTFILELAYMSIDWDAVARNDGKTDNGYRINASFGYSF